MKYLAAYLLLALGGNESPSSDDVKNLLSGSGIEVDDSALSLLMEKVSGKSIAELEAEGKERLVSIGGSASSGGGAAASGDAAGDAPVEEEEEEEEEEDVDLGGGGMFGDAEAY